MNTITESNFTFPGQTDVYKGKVRDVYTLNDGRLVMVASDRLSAFDVVMPISIVLRNPINVFSGKRPLAPRCPWMSRVGW